MGGSSRNLSMMQLAEENKKLFLQLLNYILDASMCLNGLKKNEKVISEAEVVKINSGAKNGTYGTKMKLISWRH